MKEFGNFDKDGANTSHFHFPSSRWMRPSLFRARTKVKQETERTNAPTRQVEETRGPLSRRGENKHSRNRWLVEQTGSLVVQERRAAQT
jgi:hypothetical protein